MITFTVNGIKHEFSGDSSTPVLWYLRDELNVNLRVLGLSNSRKMVIQKDGIALDKWEEVLDAGAPASIEGFYEAIVALNQRNSIFMDITANADVADVYDNYLKQSIAVVACNKIAASSAYEKYAQLKKLSKDYNAPLLFETNVGAGLPIIDTLNNLIASGDRVRKIQAVLSGSLNFVFNNFAPGGNFHDVVQQAKAEGYTEPDPRIDLSGVDVARKILILARESGLKMNLEDIKNKPFLTEENLNSDSVDDFFETYKLEIFFSSFFCKTIFFAILILISSGNFLLIFLYFFSSIFLEISSFWYKCLI